MTNEQDKRLLPASTVARICSIETKWLKQQADKGLIPCIKSGSKYAFHLPTVKDYLLEIAKGVSDES
jgi:hypothetical protein